jgi:tetratricopeptide (TPR) repeat protein
VARFWPSWRAAPSSTPIPGRPRISVRLRQNDPFAFFEQRLKERPDDLAARLDLAHRYLDAGRIEEALEQYAAALERDPDDAEAHAHVGFILYSSGRPEEGLASVDHALETAPDYPEALFIRGVILFRGLDRPSEAVEAFETYLAVAPFGSELAAAEQLIAEAEAESKGEEGA